MNPILIAMLTFLGVVAAIFGVQQMVSMLWSGRRDLVRRRLDKEFTPGPDEKQNAVFGDLNTLAKRSLEHKTGTSIDWLKAMVERSGVGVSLVNLVVSSIAMAGISAIAIGYWRNNWLAGACIGAVVGILPFLYVRHRQKARDELLLAQMSEVLDMMVRFLRAGHSMPQALREVAQEFKAPTGDLFKNCVAQQDLGLPIDSTLSDMAEKAGVPEYRILVLAIIVQQQSGGSLAEVCERLATMVRERFRVRGMIRAITAEGRMQANVLMVIPLFIFAALFVLKRDYADALLAAPSLLVGIVVSQLIGVLWIRRIVNVSF